MTVYVLEVETAYDGNYSHEIAVYKDLNKAQEILSAQYDTELNSFWQSVYSEDRYEYLKGEFTAYIQEKERSNSNHTFWNIYKREVIE